jgi:hypothetical protein
MQFGDALRPPNASPFRVTFQVDRMRYRDRFHHVLQLSFHFTDRIRFPKLASRTGDSRIGSPSRDSTRPRSNSGGA